MRDWKFLAVLSLTAVLLGIPSSAPAQLSINIGPEPGCPYGYYDLPPYNCAPYGYYGPEWFNGGVFIGAGPWFHGSHDFRGPGACKPRRWRRARPHLRAGQIGRAHV